MCRRAHTLKNTSRAYLKRLAQATAGTTRVQLLKIAAYVTVSVRRVHVQLAGAFARQYECALGTFPSGQVGQSRLSVSDLTVCPAGRPDAAAGGACPTRRKKALLDAHPRSGKANRRAHRRHRPQQRTRRAIPASKSAPRNKCDRCALIQNPPSGRREAVK